MKTTLELPDDLYRRVKVRAAAEGRSVREVTIELYQAWVSKSPSGKRLTGEEWLARWRELGSKISAALPPGESALDDLRRSRDRLDPA